MPAIYTNMPFVVEARMDDPDHFPNFVLSYTWSVVAQPPDAPVGPNGELLGVVFLNTNSVTPTILVPTPGSYSVALTAFDGVATTSAVYNFTAAPSYATSTTLSGSCVSGGSGLSSAIQIVTANATSVLSQSDANAKAALAASQSLGAVLSCCPASLTLTLPVDAPFGASYTVAVLDPNADPNEDFPLTVFSPTRSVSFIVGSGVSAGATVELFSSFEDLFTLNDATQLLVTVVETSLFGFAVEPVNYDLALAPAPKTGNLAGASLSKVQRKTLGYPPPAGTPPNPNRSLGYRLSLPAPAATRATLALTNEAPGHSPWHFDANGWDWIAGYGTANALGVFLLTGGTLTAPTSEVLILAMNPVNSEPALLNAYYNLYGYSQLRYQGSLYAPVYNDRRAYASVPHTGFVNITPSYPVSWVGALVNYVTANNVPAPWNVYFRAGTYGGGVYSWTGNSIPLYLERNLPSANVAITSLTASGSILGAANGVLSLQSAALSTPNYFFVTVRGAPTIFLDLYRFATGFPSAVQVGVYSVNNWPYPVGGTRQLGISPGPVAGRGYDTTNLLSNPALASLVATASIATPTVLAFYLETSNNTPLANSFPLFDSPLTSYAPTSPMYTIKSIIQATGNLPLGTNNVLVIQNPGAKVLLASANG